MAEEIFRTLSNGGAPGRRKSPGKSFHDVFFFFLEAWSPSSHPTILVGWLVGMAVRTDCNELLEGRRSFNWML